MRRGGGERTCRRAAGSADVTEHQIPAEPAEWRGEEGDRQRGKPQGGKTGRGESSTRSETKKRMLH